MLLSVIFKPSYSLFLISFTLFTFPAHPAGFSFCNFTSFQPFLSLLTSIYIFFTLFTFPAHPAGFPFCFLNGFLANCIACHQTTSIITSIQSFRMYFFNQGNTLYVNNSASSCSNPRISFHICQKLHLLFSELNDSKNMCFFKIICM